MVKTSKSKKEDVSTKSSSSKDIVSSSSKDIGNDPEGKKGTEEGLKVKSQKKRFSCRKCLIAAKTKLAVLAKRSVLIFYALYNIMLAAGIIFWGFWFNSALDVAYGRFAQAWLWTLMQVLIIMTSLFGLYASIRRDPQAARQYFLIMPMFVLCSIPATMASFALQCSCSSFVQCSALRAFSTMGDFVNPHPVSPNMPQYSARVKLAWKPTPVYNTNMPTSSSSLMDVAIAKANLTQQPVHTKSDDIYTQRHVEAMIGHRSKHVQHFRGRASKMYFDEDDFNLVHVTSQYKADAQNCSFKDGTNSSLLNNGLTVITADGQPLLSDGLSIPQATRAHRHSLLNGDVSMSPPGNAHKSPARFTGRVKHIDPRKVYLAGIPLSHSFESKAEVQPERCDSKAVRFREVEDKQRLLQCRKDASNSVLTRCPDSIESKLLECVMQDTCGAVKFIIAPVKAGQLHRNGTWGFTVCKLQDPVEHSGTTLDATDDSDEWNMANPLILYFERDMSESLRRAEGGELVVTFGKKLVPSEQSKMSRQSWLHYMIILRESGCFCNPASRGCAVHYDEENHANEYWCRVRREDRERCLRHQMPGGESRHMELAPLPGSTENLWTKDICMPGGNVYLDKHLDELEREKHTRRSDCACYPTLGYFIEKSHFSSMLSEESIAMYVEKDVDRILVGHKCMKWLKEDQRRWCIVGFDSACADREEVPIPGSPTRLRLFKSALPCQEEEIDLILDAAQQFCRVLRLGFWGLDVLRYILFLPMIFWAYVWACNRCMDNHRDMDSQSFVNPAAGEDVDPLSDAHDSFYSYDSYDPYDSYDSGNEDSFDGKTKAKDKAKSGGGEGSGSMKGAAKKKSEGSDDEWSADEDAPARKSKDKGYKRKPKAESPSHSGSSGGTK